jgi:hypothetical protein
MTDRRTLLNFGAVPLAAAVATSQAFAQRQMVDPAALLPKSPEEGLTQFIRMFAGHNQSSVFTNEGIIYGKVPGSLPQPLFGFLAVLDIRAREVSPGLFRSEQKEAMTYLDLATRQPLKRWRNIYNQEDQAVVGYVSPTNVYFFDKTGSAMREPPKAASTARDWRSSSNDIWVTESRFNAFPSSITEAEFPRAFGGPVRLSTDILTYRAKAMDFANARLSSVPVQLTMLSDTPWPLWMMMGKAAGGVFWHGFGQKYGRMAEIPAPNRMAIQSAYPGFLDDPWGFPSELWGTAAQLRRLKAQGQL